MRLNHLLLKNWLAHNHLDVAFQPLTLVLGPNGAGKSSVGDAIAFALTGELRRIVAKGDRPQLVTEGSDKGAVVLTCDGEGRSVTVWRDVATGKVKKPERLPAPPGAVTEALPYLLQLGRFTGGTPDDRRRLLRGLMGADLGPNAILAKLRDRGHPAVLVATLNPTASLDEWITTASRQASEARGAWKAITGEAYGTEKAEGFIVPPVNGAGADEVALIESAWRDTRDRVALLQRELGAIDAAKTAMANSAKRVSALEAAAAKATEHEAAAAEATAAWHAALESKTEAAERVVAARARQPMVAFHCPSCTAALALSADGKLMPYAAPAAPGTQEDVKAALFAHDRADTALGDALRVKEAADATWRETRLAVDTLRKLEPAMGTLLKTNEREAVEASLHEARAGEANYAEELAHAREGLAASARAEAATSRAAGFHDTVRRWSAIAAALAPDGIPGEILRAVLDPFNASLAEAAVASGWRAVQVGADMDVRVAGRAYGLLSESEQWRADAQIAVAIAKHSGFGFVLLDRFDVLDIPSRGACLFWLHRMAMDGRLDTVVVLGTTKNPPPVPAGATVVWLGPEQKGDQSP